MRIALLTGQKGAVDLRHLPYWLTSQAKLQPSSRRSAGRLASESS